MCIFCKIVQGEIPCHKVYEDDLLLVFLDINPFTYGHMLIIPKRHAADLSELNEAELVAILPLSQRLAADVRQKLGASGVNILQNNGKDAGQVVFHYHMHLIPRFAGEKNNWQMAETNHEELAKMVEILNS